MMLKPGDRITDDADHVYEVISLLGSGGFASVFGCRQTSPETSPEKRVALKVLSSPQEHARARFARERQQILQWKHRHIVAGLGSGQHDGHPFLVMEWLQGHALDVEVDTRGALEPSRALRLVEGALAGLAHAHQKGVIHNDITPSNLFLVSPHTDDEHLKLLDFGLASLRSTPGKTPDPAASVPPPDEPVPQRLTTQVGAYTPGYVAPEFLLEQGTSFRTDVYQMGLVLAELLSGAPLVVLQGEDDFSFYRQHTQGAPSQKLSQVLPPYLVHSPIFGLLERCLAVDPAARYSDADALRQALVEQLQHFLPQRPASVRVSTLSEVPQERLQKTPNSKIPTTPGQEPTAPEATSRAESPEAKPLEAEPLETDSFAPKESSLHGGRSAFFLQRKIVAGALLALMAVGFVVLVVQGTNKEREAGEFMVKVPAGDFTMGLAQGASGEKPVRRVYLGAFSIDRYEVSVEAYAACVTADVCSAPQERNEPQALCNWGVQGKEQHPINCVSWSQARDFCAWKKKRLPTEAEWEKAARGDDGRLYPWGNDRALCVRAVGDKCDEPGTKPVGSKPKGASPYGAHDMAGNVWEWVADWYREDTYRTGKTRDPTGPPRGTQRVSRGGGWDVIGFNLQSATRSSAKPHHTADSLGFRCALGAVQSP